MSLEVSFLAMNLYRIYFCFAVTFVDRILFVSGCLIDHANFDRLMNTIHMIQSYADSALLTQLATTHTNF